MTDEPQDQDPNPQPPAQPPQGQPDAAKFQEAMAGLLAKEGVDPDEAEKIAAGAAETPQQPAQAPQGQPQAAAPQGPEGQAPPQQPGQPTQEQIQAFQEQMRKDQEEAQRITQPYLAILGQKLQMRDEITLDLMGDLSHACAQLVRHLSHELTRQGQMKEGVISSQPPQKLPDGRMQWPFLTICGVMLQGPVLGQYMDAPGPQFWMQYLQQRVDHDLAARLEGIQRRRQAMQQTQGAAPSQNPGGPRATFRPGVKPRQPGQKRTSRLGGSGQDRS